MRRLRVLVVMALAGCVVWGTMPAGADGGAFIEFDQTYYLPGDTAVARAYVRIPKNKRSILDRGRCFACPLPHGSGPHEGHAVPDRAGALCTLARHTGKHATRPYLAFATQAAPGGT